MQTLWITFGVIAAAVAVVLLRWGCEAAIRSESNWRRLAALYPVSVPHNGIVWHRFQNLLINTRNGNGPLPYVGYRSEIKMGLTTTELTIVPFLTIGPCGDPFTVPFAELHDLSRMAWGHHLFSTHRSPDIILGVPGWIATIIRARQNAGPQHN